MGKREANSIFGSVTLIVILFIQVSFVIAAEFGSFEKPFTSSSLWYSKPIDPVFDSFVIPTSNYFPAIQ